MQERDAGLCAHDGHRLQAYLYLPCVSQLPHDQLILTVDGKVMGFIVARHTQETTLRSELCRDLGGESGNDVRVEQAGHQLLLLLLLLLLDLLPLCILQPMNTCK
jgi:hypothetical protein